MLMAWFWLGLGVIDGSELRGADVDHAETSGQGSAEAIMKPRRIGQRPSVDVLLIFCQKPLTKLPPRPNVVAVGVESVVIGDADAAPLAIGFDAGTARVGWAEVFRDNRIHGLGWLGGGLVGQKSTIFKKRSLINFGADGVGGGMEPGFRKERGQTF